MVHLALELLQDAQQIQDWLRSSTTMAQTTKKLYWRSAPQPPNKQQPCFVDVTFTIASDGPSPKIQMQFGYLTIQSGSSGASHNNNISSKDDDSFSSSTYCCCRDPFSPDDLSNHATSLDLVLDEADPRAFSASLARALESNLRLGQDGNRNSLQCYYDELDQWGCLLRCGPEGGRMSESKLDATCTNLLLQNLRTFDGSDNKTIREIDRTAVDHALQQYWAEWNDSSAAVAVEELLVVAPPVSSNSSAKAMVAGYRQIPNNKRRRRGLSELKLKASNS
jgi:hypothetical protein